MCTYTNTFHYLSKSDDLNWLKGRDLALSYDKTPHINKKSKIQSLGTKSHKKLRLHLSTVAEQLTTVKFYGFIGLQDRNFLTMQKMCHQKDTSLKNENIPH